MACPAVGAIYWTVARIRVVDGDSRTGGGRRNGSHHQLAIRTSAAVDAAWTDESTAGSRNTISLGFDLRKRSRLGGESPERYAAATSIKRSCPAIDALNLWRRYAQDFGHLLTVDFEDVAACLLKPSPRDLDRILIGRDDRVPMRMVAFPKDWQRVDDKAKQHIPAESKTREAVEWISPPSFSTVNRPGIPGDSLV